MRKVEMAEVYGEESGGERGRGERGGEEEETRREKVIVRETEEEK